MPKYILALGALCVFSLIGYHLAFTKQRLHVQAFPTDPSKTQESARIMHGDTFSVSLPHNPSTPFMWRVVSSNQAVALQTNEDYVQDETPQSDVPLVGVPGVRTWQFNARDTGTSTISFELQSITDPTNIVQRYTLDVTVE